MGADSNRLAVLAWVLIAGLLLARVPSLAEPAGADQALYSYIGQRILAGDVPYRDAWDQKPPGVHLAYAGLIAIWPHESVVAGADLLLAALTAFALVAIGRRLLPGSGAGEMAAIAFLLLGNPALGRLGGVRVRAQCEAFISPAVAGALLAGWRATRSPRANRVWLALAGGLVGVAMVFKYNAVVYLLPVAMVLASRTEEPQRARRTLENAVWLAAGAALPMTLVLAWLAGAGALDDLYRATITYNVQYSGETYAGRFAIVRYLLTFPVRYALIDPLWFVGGVGSAALVARAARRRASWVGASTLTAPVWVACACLAIAINGSRGLPQYFVQAAPALALAAGLAAAWAWSALRWAPRTALALIVTVAVVRVANFPKLVDNTMFDLRSLQGDVPREAYLSKFGNADSGDKFSALAVTELASLVRARTAPGDPVYVFGFSPWAYVGSGRVSPSRFFWSRPVIIGFEQGRPGYGVEGLLASLQARTPRLIVLQERDWDPDVTNSADFFLGNPTLSHWLHEHYVQTDRLHNFQIWTRRSDS